MWPERGGFDGLVGPTFHGGGTNKCEVQAQERDRRESRHAAPESGGFGAQGEPGPSLPGVRCSSRGRSLASSLSPGNDLGVRSAEKSGPESWRLLSLSRGFWAQSRAQLTPPRGSRPRNRKGGRRLLPSPVRAAGGVPLNPRVGGMGLGHRPYRAEAGREEGAPRTPPPSGRGPPSAPGSGSGPARAPPGHSLIRASRVSGSIAGSIRHGPPASAPPPAPRRSRGTSSAPPSAD